MLKNHKLWVKVLVIVGVMGFAMASAVGLAMKTHYDTMIASP